MLIYKFLYVVIYVVNSLKLVTEKILLFIRKHKIVNLRIFFGKWTLFRFARIMNYFLFLFSGREDSGEKQRRCRCSSLIIGGLDNLASDTIPLQRHRLFRWSLDKWGWKLARTHLNHHQNWSRQLHKIRTRISFKSCRFCSQFSQVSRLFSPMLEVQFCNRNWQGNFHNCQYWCGVQKWPRWEWYSIWWPWEKRVQWWRIWLFSIVHLWLHLSWVST